MKLKDFVKMQREDPEYLAAEQDLIQDFVSVITSFCARIYGRRRSKRKTEQLIEKLKNED